VKTYLLDFHAGIWPCWGSKEVNVFLRKYTRPKDGKQHVYYALVESLRTGSGPRQQVVAYLGELNHDQERRWQRTVVFHNRQGEARQLRLFADDDHVPLSDDPDVVRIRLNSVGWTNGRSFGDVWLGRWLWQQLHLDEIVARHLPQGRQSVRPADMVAIEVINRLCAPCSEFALAEHWYASTGLEDLLGIPDNAITKDRLYRTLDLLRQAQTQIEDELKEQFGTLFRLDFDLLLYDLTSTYFEGLAEDNALARRGYSRDHRSDCKQIVLALVVTREGFALAHFTMAGNTKDGDTVRQIVTAVEKRFGKTHRVWVMDRGMISKENLAFLKQRRYLLATRRSKLAKFRKQLLATTGWQRLPQNEEVEVRLIRRGRLTYVLARSQARRAKERAIRRRQLLGLQRTLKKLQARVAQGRLKKRDKIVECIGRYKDRFPKANALVTIAATEGRTPQLRWSWRTDKIKLALAQDGAYLLQSNQPGWSASDLWETYMQLTVVEKAFRVLKSDLLLRPVWHQYDGRVQAHVFICVLAYALWKTLDHLAKRTGLQTLIHKPAEQRGPAQPKPRPMTPEVILRELYQIQIGDILLETTTGQKLALRRVARPNAEQTRILSALGLQLPERLSPDRLL
jgi:transposase